MFLRNLFHCFCCCCFYYSPDICIISYCSILGFSSPQDMEPTNNITLFDMKKHHQMKELDDETFQYLVESENYVSFESLLDPILIPRVPGTTGHVFVKEFIMSHMDGLGWTIETDAFEDETPHGVKPFENIIATLNPITPRRLVLACHFDSKYSEDDSFIGAIDSAVSCAMLLHMASTMANLLNEHKNSQQDVTLQFIFFDGEEAFENWSMTDSLYGSKHLAAKWASTSYPPNNEEGTTELDRMDMMILLDLLGTANITLKSFFQNTNHWHDVLVETEEQLKRADFWIGSQYDSIFQSELLEKRIGDDHVPFVVRGVPIIHLIPSPFPDVWHKPSDNKESLDFPTISNLNAVLRVFVAKYLHLSVAANMQGCCFQFDSSTCDKYDFFLQ